MAPVFELLKSHLAGEWHGKGFARFPTITDTAYTEVCIFTPDTHKPVIRFEQKSWYKNDGPENGKTVFWDTGFLLMHENEINLVSAQSGGRLETYKLVEFSSEKFVFNSELISNDLKTIRSQRVLVLNEGRLHYELNMSTRQADVFQNHLKATLIKQ